MATGTWALGWATNDIVSAAEFGKGVGSISDTTLGGSAASIDITGIIGSYAHLLIVAYLRSDTAAASTGLIVRLNGDSAANYNSATTGVTSLFTGTNATMPGASETSNWFSASAIVIPHYAGTANDKSAVLLTAYNDVGLAHQYKGDTGGGIWKNAAAVTRVTVSPAAGSLIAGSRLTIYAMGA